MRLGRDVEKNNRARVSEALEHLVGGVAGPVDDALCAYIGDDWNDLWVISGGRRRESDWSLKNAALWHTLPRTKRDSEQLRRTPIAKTDPQYFLKALRDFQPAFALGDLATVAGSAGLASDLLKLRHLWAHDFSGDDRAVSDADAERALDLMENLLESVGATAFAVAVRRIRLQAPEWDGIDWDYFNEQSRAIRHIADLVGREGELARLQRFFTGADETRLLVAGERYAGKSALLAEAFISPASADSVLLGYFLADPVSERRNATSEAMVRSLVHQAHVILQGEDFVVDSSESVNSAVLTQLLRKLVAHAKRDDKKVVVIIDGIDQDASGSDGDQSVVDVLDSLLGIDLRLVVSAWSDRIPERIAGWPKMSVLRNSAVTARLGQMSAEVEALFDADELPRNVLRFLTYAGGPFEVGEFAQLCNSNPRAVRKIFAGPAARLFSATRGDDTEATWTFAHPKYREIAEGLFKDSAPAWPAAGLSPSHFDSHESDTLAEVKAWAETYANAGWPTESPRYLLSGYPRLLATREDQASLQALLLDVRYLSAVEARLGSANSISELADVARRLVTGATSADIRDLAILGSVHDNFKRTPDRLAPIVVEAIGVIWAGAGLRDVVIDLLAQKPSVANDWSFPALREGGHGHVRNNRAVLIRSVARADPSDTVLGDGFWLPGHRFIERARVLRSRGRLDAHRALLDAVQKRADGLEGQAQLRDLAALAMLHFEAGDEASASRCAAAAQSALDPLVDDSLDGFGEESAREVIYDAGCEVAIALVWGGRIDHAFVEFRHADRAALGNGGHLGPDNQAVDLRMWPALLREDPLAEVTRLLDMRDPLRDLVLALVATGNEARATDFVNDRVRGRESPLRQFMVMLAARMFDDAFELVGRLYATEEPARLLVWRTFLLALIAHLGADDVGRRAVDRIRELADAAPGGVRREILRYLCWGLTEVGELAEVENHIDELADPYEALQWQMEVVTAAGDLDEAVRVVGHKKWANRHAPARMRTSVLALLALGEHRSGEVERAGKTLRDALAVATGPQIAADPSRQEVVNAALGCSVDWAWLLAEASESSIRAIAAAAQALPAPSAAGDLVQVGRTLPLLQGAKALQSETTDTDLHGLSAERVRLLSGLGAMTALEVDSEVWHQATIAIVDALARAGDLAAVRFVGSRAIEQLMAWYERGTDFEHFAEGNLEYGTQLMRLRRLGVRLPHDEVEQAFRDFAKQYLDAVEHSKEETQDLALIETRAARSLLLAALDEPRSARVLAARASRALVDFDSPDANGTGWEAALISCVTALASLPDADLDDAVRLTLYVGIGARAAELASYLLSAGAENAKTLLEVNLAGTVLRKRSWIDSIEMLRALDSTVIKVVAQFEDSLRIAVADASSTG